MPVVDDRYEVMSISIAIMAVAIVTMDSVSIAAEPVKKVRAKQTRAALSVQ